MSMIRDGCLAAIRMESRTVPHPGKNRPRYWAYFPLGGAWLTTHAWEQYAFGGDTEYLRTESWPIIAGTADFLVDYLYELPTGQLSSTPSWSPEHGPISKGTTADIAMARIISLIRILI